MPAALHCGNCGGAMRVLQLAGHYGTRVEIDLCAPCHLVWFDAVEGARLAGPGLLDLIGEMAQAHALAHQPLRPRLSCLRCQGTVRTVHNQTRWGRSQQLECAQRHGAWQSFAQFLAEKGLLRPMSSADRARALARDGGLLCVNCGGALQAGDTQCPWCQSVPAVLDVARLARALDPEGATQGHAVHRTGAANTALGCQACGAVLPQDAGWQCPQCQATVTAPRLAEAHGLVSALGPGLREHARKPAPHIVQQRLAAQSGGLKRQRAWAKDMQAEADARAGQVLGQHDTRPQGAWLSVLLEAAASLLARWLK
jgi:RNA polymerase subunit RPABC4/transcription elongation factor Spt4